MKRKLCVVLLLAGVAASGFSLDRAFGGGGLFGESFNSGEVDLSSLGLGKKAWSTSRTAGGAFAFYGVNQFTELNFGVLYKSVSGGLALPTSTALQLGAYGKYPIPLSDKLVFFPTGGVDAEITLETGWWHDLWIRGGVGMDLFLSEKWFIRGHLIYGASIPFSDAGNGTNIGHGLLVKIGYGFMF